ncbi:MULTISPECIES: cytosine permease [Clostridia]|uniref:cytosine permease n=1 Tax=Clostridium sp. CCUG 7971 TaxID=2811414 RepID=UPI001ABBD39A|nr:cytosine permease [Clostridium sp. CCUG 7971]MBO3446300.1 cytosine permease [Clostridium sp. CCUG 7971]
MSKKHHDHDYSLEAIPSNSKKGFIPMLVVMLGFTFFSASMLAGGNLGTSLRMDQFITAVIIGNTILCVYTGLLAYMAGDTGLSTHLLARYSFGEKGSYLVSFLVSATQVGWFGVGVAMFAIPVSKVTGIDVGILVLVSGILMTATAFFGMKSLTILSMIAVPSIAILGSISAGKAIGDVGGMTGLLAIEPTGTMTMSAALASVVGTFISGGTLTADFTRFSKSKKIAVSTTVIAFLIGNSLMLAFGAIGAMVTGQSDIAEVMFMQGLIIPAIIILGLNIWTTNDNALYGSGLGFSNITKQPKNRMVIINGIVGTLLAMFLYNNFMGWLNLLNSFIPATGAIIIADYFILNKAKYVDFKIAKFKNLNINAIVAWVAGVIGAYAIPGITPLNSVLTAIVTYVALSKINTKSNDIEIKKAA